MILSILMIAGNVVFKKYYSRPVVTDGFDYRAPAASRNKANLTSEITSCNFSVKSYELTFRSQVILSRSLLPKKPEADFLKNSVEEQLKFLYGYFNYGNRHGNEKIFLTSKKIELSNLRTTSAEYPEKIDINEEWTEHPTNIYVENAHEIRKVKKGEQAVAIDYEATLVFRTCGAFPEKKVEILLPKDPFLAYWAIDTSQFIKATYLGSEATINPCSNSSFAEIRKSSWFWYTWDPVSELCKSQIKGSKFYTLATGQVKAREDLSSVPINAGFFSGRKKPGGQCGDGFYEK